MEKNIWITGDNYGVPNLNTHDLSLETILISKEYKVKNFSIIGASNTGAFKNIDKYFEEKKIYPDILIWFHTDLARDWGLINDQWTYQQRVLDTAISTYTLISNIIKKINTKLIVIEGQSVVVDPYFSEIINPDVIIKDWRSEILGETMPQSQIISRSNFLFDKYCVNTDQEKNDLKENVNLILEKMRNSNQFQDNIHPNKYQYLLLGERIHTCIELLIK